MAFDSPSAAAVERERPPLLDNAGFDLAGDEEKASSPEEEDSVNEGVPSVQVGVGVAAELPPIFRLLISALPSEDALLSDRTSSCTSDMLMASICESKRLTMSLLLLAGCFCLSPSRRGLKLVADSVDRGSDRVLSEGPDRRTSSNAGGGVDEEEGVEGTLRSSPTSSLPRGGRKDTFAGPAEDTAGVGAAILTRLGERGGTGGGGPLEDPVPGRKLLGTRSFRTAGKLTG